MLLTLFFSVLSSLSISQQVDTIVVHYLSTNMADFPDNYTEYWNLYCDPKAPLYYSSQEIALELYNSDIDKTILCNKLMGIAVDAVWEVDNINFLKYTLWQYIKEYPEIFILQMNGFSSRKVSLLWRFMFSGPHPSNYKPEYYALINDDRFKKYRRKIIDSYRYNLDKERKEHIIDKCFLH